MERQVVRAGAARAPARGLGRALQAQPAGPPVPCAPPHQHQPALWLRCAWYPSTRCATTCGKKEKIEELLGLEDGRRSCDGGAACNAASEGPCAWCGHPPHAPAPAGQDVSLRPSTVTKPTISRSREEPWDVQMSAGVRASNYLCMAILLTICACNARERQLPGDHRN